MTSQEIQTIIPQIPGESDASYTRLIIMLEQEISTLDKLFNYLEKKQPDKAVSISQLKKCSAKDNWTERRKKYQEIRDQEIQEEIQDLFKELNTMGIQDMQECLQDLNTLRTDIMKQYNEGAYKASYVLKILRDYINIYRQATEIYYINSRHTLFPQEQENTEDNTRDYDKIREAIRGKSE